MVGCRGYGNGLLGEAVKEQPASMGAPSIEAEGELVEVILEMPVLHAALMGSHQPSAGCFELFHPERYHWGRRV